jgi:hypothetical protein
MVSKFTKIVALMACVVPVCANFESAKAEFLLAADSIFSRYEYSLGETDFMWPIGPNNETTLSFKTDKPSESVEVAFSANCGTILGIGVPTASNPVSTYSLVYFTIDSIQYGGIILCFSDRANTTGFVNGSDIVQNVFQAIARKHLTIASKGNHTLQIQVTTINSYTAPSEAGSFIGASSTTVLK